MSRALFWVHDAAAPSFRHRLAAHIPAFEAAGIRCEVETFPRRSYGARVLSRAGRLPEFDLLVIAKFKLETGERWLVRRRARRIVYDFDDAIYFGKPDRPGAEPDRSPRRVESSMICAIADRHRGERTPRWHRRSGRRVENRSDGNRSRGLRHSVSRPNTGRIAWIGLPGNLPYLSRVEEPMRRLAQRRPGLRLVVISERPPASFAAPVEFVPWSKATEAAVLSGCDVGIMPLDDEDWTRGKGGFKLLQYMAAGLPTVASPVGVNGEITVEGGTGYLASAPGEWEDRIERLLDDAVLRGRLGLTGRRRVEDNYAMPIIARRLVELYRDVIGQSR